MYTTQAPPRPAHRQFPGGPPLAGEFFAYVRVHVHGPRRRSLGNREVRARASALTRTTSGSRGSAGRISCDGCSRATLGLWIRMRFTVGQLLGRSPWEWANKKPFLSAGPVLRGRYEQAPVVGVTPRCAARWNLPRPRPALKCRCGRRVPG